MLQHGGVCASKSANERGEKENARTNGRNVAAGTYVTIALVDRCTVGKQRFDCVGVSASTGNEQNRVSLMEQKSDENRGRDSML